MTNEGAARDRLLCSDCMRAGSKTRTRVLTPEIVREELDSYERRYGMKSSEFLRLYRAGKMHEHDAMPWEFYCDMAEELGVEFD